MSKIVIDARESGTSTGRYIDKLIEYLFLLKPAHEIVVITKPHRVEFLRTLAPGFEIVVSEHKEFTFAEQLGFKQLLDGLKADLIHFGMVQQPILYRGTVVTTIHDLTTVRFANPDKNPLVFTAKQQVYKQVIKRAAAKSKIIITGSEFVKKDLLAFTGVNPNKVRVVYESADQIREKAVALPQLKNKTFIMYVGRPTPHKNLQRLIDAFKILQQSHPDLHLVLAGKLDSNYQRIRAGIAPQLAKNVVFTDFVSDGQLRWLYQNCSVYVFPSLSEGFGLPGLEAMVEGAPLASSNATCLPEIYGAAASYFDPLDVPRMAKTIDEIMTNKTLRQSLIAKGKKQAKKYSWARMAKQTYEIYLEALAR